MEPLELRRRLLPVAGAALVPLLFSAYLAALGHPLPSPVGTGRAEPVLSAATTGSLAGIGALAGASRTRGLRAPLVGATVGFLALPWLWQTRPCPGVPGLGCPDASPGSFYAFAMPALFLLVGCCLLAAAEYAARSPETVRGAMDADDATVGVAAGVALYLVVEGLRVLAFGLPSMLVDYRGLFVLFGLFVALGVVLLGAVPTVLLRVRGLVTPALVVAGLYGFAIYRTWVYVESLDGATMAAAFTPLTGAMVGWFVVLALALTAGAVEHAVRGSLGREAAQ